MAGLFSIFAVLLNLFATLRGDTTICKSSFPQGFIFGAGSSAQQIEGATNIDGKGQNIWDYHTHQNPNIVADLSNADVADDFYHRYKEDIQLMKQMGLDSFRFSLSWSRILPNGSKAGGVNQLGIDFYNNVINELLANGIQPFVTLYHWDVPHALEVKYGGLLSDKIVGDFVDYADVCFKAFGDRVKNWVTVNEPNIQAVFGYAKGFHVPNRCTPGLIGYMPCTAGNSSTEPYIVAHNLLLAHASIVNLYRSTYQASQKGKIGITVACGWVEPFDDQPSSKAAADRYFEQSCGWFFNPVTFGDYPQSMRSLIGGRLPTFTTEQSNLLKKSFDFFGLNYYSAEYAQDLPKPTLLHYDQDDHAIKTFYNKNGTPIGPPTPAEWIFEYPQGLEKVLLLLQQKYENPVIIITENGYATKDARNTTYTREQYLRDPARTDFIKQHLQNLLQAIKSGANVKGYFAWSFMDNFEWGGGYVYKYGLHYVDRTSNNLTRCLKDSGNWYKTFLQS